MDAFARLLRRLAAIPGGSDMLVISQRMTTASAAALMVAAAYVSVSGSPPAAAKGGGGMTTSTSYSVSAGNASDTCASPSTASQSFQTIQAAITCAEQNGGAFTINVAPGTYDENLRLGASGPDSLTIIGTGGAANTTINGGNVTRTIASYLPDASDCGTGGCTQVTATIRGFTITGGAGKVLESPLLGTPVVVGGGVYNGPGSNLSLVNDVVTGNDVSQVDDGFGGTLFGMGGGIFNDGFAALTLSATTVTGNSASAGGGIAVAPLYYQCPIYLCFAGTVHLQTSSVSGNTATGFGGGLMASTNGSVTVSSSTFSGNEALGADVSLPGFDLNPWTGMGGAIASVPQFFELLTPGGHVSLTASNLTWNTAENGGGAVANIGGKLTMTGGTTAHNTATNGPGGAILNWVEASALLRTPNINANTAATVGGGIANCWQSSLNLAGGKIQGNTAGQAPPSGGGVDAETGSPWTAVNTAIRGNAPDQTASTDCWVG
jgi:hypothetical protein